MEIKRTSHEWPLKCFIFSHPSTWKSESGTRERWFPQSLVTFMYIKIGSVNVFSGNYITLLKVCGNLYQCNNICCKLGISLLFQLVNFATDTIGFILRKSACVFSPKRIDCAFICSNFSALLGNFFFYLWCGLFGLAIPL
jgi:hypothetical protein